jgi:hypothetical protein
VSPTPGITASSSTGTRDPLKQPFASDSIWNMPIGSSATYLSTGWTALQDTYATNSFFQSPGVDDDLISLDKNAPLTNVETNNVGWGAGDRCADQGATLTTVPIPTSWTVPDSGENNSAALLAADGRTIKQMQPFTRCVAGSFATALLTFADQDLYGAGITGSHGGSRMSALGGTIRLGELRPGQQGPRHALKMNIDADQFFYNCSTGPDCFRWPAQTADSGATSNYGSQSGLSNTAATMGMLLAIPPSVDINALGLQSEPGRQLAWTLQNYGAYVVDTSGDGFAIAAESGPNGSKQDEFFADYGLEMYKHNSRQAINEGWTPPTFGASTTWTNDWQKLWVQLKIVNNNTSTSIGGGGTPRQPLAPPIAP